MAVTLARIVENDLCIGCGLCASVAGRERVALRVTPEGTDRPMALQQLDRATEERIAAVCPGIRVEGPRGRRDDAMWGSSLRSVRGHASDPDVRFRGSSGGALTALATYLLESGAVEFVLHVAASPTAPMRTERRLSFTAADVLGGAGSRYGPATPLVDFCELLDRGRRFAVVGKPCDVAAIRNLARIDPRVDQLVPYLLTFFCGGASELAPPRAFAAEHGVEERDLRLFRYRGHGNPGMTRMETLDGRAFERSYEDFWTGDERNWKLQFRCKICPDAIGEQADVAVMDVWPGGMPVAEDEGFNGFVARTPRGLALLEEAAASGAITLLDDFGVRELDDFQPHHRRRKEAVLARAVAVVASSRVPLRFRRLGLLRCAAGLGPARNLRNLRGALRRIRARRTR